MPISRYFGGHGSKVMQSMQKQYGAEKGKQVFYATANKRGKGPKGSGSFKKSEMKVGYRRYSA